MNDDWARGNVAQIDDLDGLPVKAKVVGYITDRCHLAEPHDGFRQALGQSMPSALQLRGALRASHPQAGTTNSIGTPALCANLTNR